jgi:hypothetical protein
MRRFVVFAAMAGVAVVAVGAGTAAAAQPTSPGCVGASVSANAVALHPYGRFVSGIAPRNDFGTVGDAVHAVQAGQIPDEVYPNSCN